MAKRIFPTAMCDSGQNATKNDSRLTKFGVLTMPAYIKIPDIDGEVEEQNHEKWIEVDSVSMPIFRSITQ